MVACGSILRRRSGWRELLHTHNVWGDTFFAKTDGTARQRKLLKLRHANTKCPQSCCCCRCRCRRLSSNYLAVVCQWIPPGRVLRTLPLPLLRGVGKVQLLRGGGESDSEAHMCTSGSAEMRTLRRVHVCEVKGGVLMDVAKVCRAGLPFLICLTAVTLHSQLFHVL